MIKIYITSTKFSNFNYEILKCRIINSVKLRSYVLSIFDGINEQNDGIVVSIYVHFILSMRYSSKGQRCNISDAVTTSHQQFFPFFNDTIYRIYNFGIFS